MNMILRLNFVRGRAAALALGILVTIFRLAPGLCCEQTASSLGQQWLAPCALSVSLDGRILYAATARSPGIIALEVGSEKTRRIWSLADEPTGIALRDKPAALIVTCSGVGNWITLLEPTTGKQLARWPARPGVCSPVVSVIKNHLYVCNRFDHSVGVHDLENGREMARLGVIREPVAAALTPDERWLVVANHLPGGPANVRVVGAVVTIIDTGSFAVRTNIMLPNGSVSVRGVSISPDGQFGCVVHNLARFQVPTTQVENGWMNDGALSLIDLRRLSLRNTVLLDEPTRGAANPWAVAWAADGGTLCAAHAGTHELSLIDAPALLERLAGEPPGSLVNDLALLKGIRRRISLKGKGPRALVLSARTAYVAEFFSDSISPVDLQGALPVDWIQLSEGGPADKRRQGEMLFHDATLSYQGWQSCASCHPAGRADGLNWDLLNDGIGNPKNTKSLLLAHQTPPAMSMGVRETAEQAVRSGLRHILFAVRAESDAKAIDEYLKALRPIPSPWLVNGKLSPAAKRGQRIYEDPKVGCSGCHPMPLFTDRMLHAVGTESSVDRADEPFDTPTLIECWRTAPYLHDGSVVTVRELLTTLNRQDRHGRTSHLAQEQIDELAAYVLSL